jgi:hypothetical protein
MAVTNPKQPSASSLEAYAGYEASPLVTQNLIEKIVPINPELDIRWLNRVAGDGLRLNSMIYAGFELYKPEELKMKDGSKIPAMMLKDGKVMFGDLIAGKMTKVKYRGAKRHNYEVALASANRMAVDQSVVNKVNTEIHRGVPNEIRSKVQAFIPSPEEIKSKVGE